MPSEWTAGTVERPARALRWGGLAVLAVNAALVVALAVAGSVVARPGGPRYLVLALAGLAAYAGAVVAVTVTGEAWVREGRRTGVVVGVITGVMWLLNLLIETFAGLSGMPALAATAPLLLGGFALWGVAGAIGRRRTGSLGAGLLAAVVAAMTCVSITLVLGFTLPFLALTRLAQNIDGSPEYLGSGWHDLPAFAIANTLDAGFTHLLVAPVVAVITGAVGAGIAGAVVGGGGRPGGSRPEG